MFKHAIQWGYLDANPALYVKRPRLEIDEAEILTAPEIRRLLQAAEEPVWSAAGTMPASWCGALEVDDVVLAEARRMSLDDIHQRVHDGPDVEAVDSRWAEHDSRVRAPLLDGITT